MPGNVIAIRSQYQDGATAGLLALQRSAKASSGAISTGFASATGPLSRVEKGLGGVGNALNHAKGQIGGVVSSLGLMAGTAGFLGLGVAIGKTISSAKDYAAEMELLATQTGASQREVDSMSAALLKLAPAVGTAPEDLAKGLYHVESAGLRGAKALEILTVAAEGAKVGNADLESVTNALIAANQSGVKGVQDMASAMGTLNAIVGSGNMRMQDLTDAMGTGVLSTAKNYGVSIQSVGAALASMTDQGIPAIDAATRLNSAMRLMAAPAKANEKALKAIGLSGLELANDMRGPGGILAAIVDLKDHLDKSGLSASQQAQVIARAFGGKQSGAILTLIGNVDLLRQKVDAVNAGAAGFGDAWAKTTQEAEFKMDRFNAVVGELGIKIGDVILPSITEAVGTVGEFVDKHQGEIVSAVKSGLDTAKTIAGAVVSAVGAIAKLWNGIDPGLRDLLLKGFIADRAVKWLIGIDPAKAVIKATVSGIEGALGKGVGSALAGAGLGKLFVQPVFVTNPGFGGGLPGGGPGGPGGPPVPGGKPPLPPAIPGLGTLADLTGFGLGPLAAGVLTTFGLMDVLPYAFKNPNAPSQATLTNAQLATGMGGGIAMSPWLMQQNALNRAAGVPGWSVGGKRPVPVSVVDLPPGARHDIQAGQQELAKLQTATRQGDAKVDGRMRDVKGAIESKAAQLARSQQAAALTAATRTDTAFDRSTRELKGTMELHGQNQERVLATIANKNFAPKVSVMVDQDEKFYITGGTVSRVTASFIGKMTKQLAAGGRYRKGEPRLVGEDGPELDIPDHSGTIIPHDLTRRLTGIARARSVGGHAYAYGQSGPLIGSIYVDARGADNPGLIEAAARRGLQAAADRVAQTLRDQNYRTVGGRATP